jgi:molecular chaperone DnaJ
MNLKQAIKTLDLKRFHDAADLKARFHDLAHTYHPDKNTSADAVQNFRNIVEAYEFLLDHLLELYQAFGVQEPHKEDETAKSAVTSLDDVFEDIFGFSKSGRVLGYQEPQPVYLTIEEFALGCEKKERLIAYVKCPTCHGSGARKDNSPRLCTYCFGQGSILSSKGNDRRDVCPRCHGRGRKTKEPCPTCDGFGRVRQRHVQEFTIPVGFKPYAVYTLAGFDTHLKRHTEIFVEPRPLRHKIFKIENHDLLCEYHLDFETMADHQVIRLKTPLGEAPLKLPKEVKHNDVVCVKGYGFFKDAQKKERGNLIVTLKQKKKVWWKSFFGE